MIHVRIRELLKERGRTKYWLNKQTNIDYKNLSHIIEDETNSMRFDTMEKLCIVLECTPNDLFEIISSEAE